MIQFQKILHRSRKKLFYFLFSEDSRSSIYRKKCKKGAIFSGFVKNSTESWTKNFNLWNNSTESWTKNFNLWNKVTIFY